MSLDQWNGFTVDGKRAYHDIGIVAIRSVTGYRAVADQLRTLGQLRYEPAVPTQTRLWEHCPVEPIRIAAGHALFGIGTSEAHAALRVGVYDHDRLARFMAMKIMFTDQGVPWDNVGWLFSGDRLATASGQAAAFEALRFLSRTRGQILAVRTGLDRACSTRDNATAGHATRRSHKL